MNIFGLRMIIRNRQKFDALSHFSEIRTGLSSVHKVQSLRPVGFNEELVSLALTESKLRQCKEY
jgi:hypothetical protein